MVNNQFGNAMARTLPALQSILGVDVCVLSLIGIGHPCPYCTSSLAKWMNVNVDCRPGVFVTTTTNLTTMNHTHSLNLLLTLKTSGNVDSEILIIVIGITSVHALLVPMMHVSPSPPQV